MSEIVNLADRRYALRECQAAAERVDIARAALNNAHKAVEDAVAEYVFAMKDQFDTYAKAARHE